MLKAAGGVELDQIRFRALRKPGMQFLQAADTHVSFGKSSTDDGPSLGANRRHVHVANTLCFGAIIRSRR